MKTSIAAGSLLVALSLVGSLHAQQVVADVAVWSGPVAGRVVIGDGYSTYRRPVAYRRVSDRVIVVERVYVRNHRPEKHWSQRGFRPVVLYYRDGRYYERYVPGGAGMREVIVYERDGRFYQECDARDRGDRDGYRHGYRHSDGEQDD